MKIQLFGKKPAFDLGAFSKTRKHPVLGEYFELTPAEFYPAMVAHIREAIQSPDLPAELVDRDVNPQIDPLLAARRYYNYAKRIPEGAWSDALVPLAVLLSKPHIDIIKRVRQRAEALELARLWFTRAAKNQAGRPIGIHILKDENFRLGTEDFSLAALMM